MLFKNNASIKFHTGRQVTDSLVRNALNGNRGGSSSFGDSGSGGGGGSGFLNSLRYGGLFNENNGHGQGQGQNKPKVTVSGAGPGGTLLLPVFVQILFNFHNHLTISIYIHRLSNSGTRLSNSSKCLSTTIVLTKSEHAEYKCQLQWSHSKSTNTKTTTVWMERWSTLILAAY